MYLKKPLPAEDPLAWFERGDEGLCANFARDMGAAPGAVVGSGRGEAGISIGPSQDFICCQGKFQVAYFTDSSANST